MKLKSIFIDSYVFLHVGKVKHMWKLYFCIPAQKPADCKKLFWWKKIQFFLPKTLASHPLELTIAHVTTVIITPPKGGVTGFAALELVATIVARGGIAPERARRRSLAPATSISATREEKGEREWE